MYKLNGKVVLVTGAARKSGIGRAAALRLAGEGADVVVVGRYRPFELFPEEEKAEGWHGLESLVSEIEAKGRQALAITADVTLNQEVSQMVELALSKFGRIDILVNNAGVAHGLIPLVDLDEDRWKEIIAINLTGPFLCSKAVAKSMIERGGGGKIINISSRAGRQGISGLGAYSASKFGLIGLTQVLALELAPYKINVNAICPGQTTTDMARQDYPGLTWKEIGKRLTEDHVTHIPLGRLGTPEDVVNVIVFLASSETDYMTGQAINVTGGRRMD